MEDRSCLSHANFAENSFHSLGAGSFATNVAIASAKIAWDATTDNMAESTSVANVYWGR